MEEDSSLHDSTRKRKAEDDSITHTAKHQFLDDAVDDLHSNLSIADEVNVNKLDAEKDGETMEVIPDEEQHQDGEEHKVFNKFIEPIGTNHTRTTPVVQDDKTFVQNDSNSVSDAYIFKDNVDNAVMTTEFSSGANKEDDSTQKKPSLLYNSREVPLATCSHAKPTEVLNKDELVAEETNSNVFNDVINNENTCFSEVDFVSKNEEDIGQKPLTQVVQASSEPIGASKHTKTTPMVKDDKSRGDNNVIDSFNDTVIDRDRNVIIDKDTTSDSISGKDAPILIHDNDEDGLQVTKTRHKDDDDDLLCTMDGLQAEQPQHDAEQQVLNICNGPIETNDRRNSTTVENKHELITPNKDIDVSNDDVMKMDEQTDNDNIISGPINEEELGQKMPSFIHENNEDALQAKIGYKDEGLLIPSEGAAIDGNSMDRIEVTQTEADEQVWNNTTEPIRNCVDTESTSVVNNDEPIVKNNDSDVIFIMEIGKEANCIHNDEQDIGQKTPSQANFNDGMGGDSDNGIQAKQDEAMQKQCNISTEPFLNCNYTESTPVVNNDEPVVENNDINNDKNTVPMGNEIYDDFYSFFDKKSPPTLGDQAEIQGEQKLNEAETTVKKMNSIVVNKVICAVKDEDAHKDVIVTMEIDVDKDKNVENVEIYNETDSFDHNEEDTASLIDESNEVDLYDVMEEEDDLLNHPGDPLNDSGEHQQEEVRDELDEFLGGESLVDDGLMEGDVPQDQENEPDLPVGAMDGKEGSVTNDTPCTSTAVASTSAASTSSVEMVDVSQLYDLTMGQVEDQYVNKMKKTDFKLLVNLFCGTTGNTDNADSEDEEDQDQKGSETEAATYELELVLRMVRTPKNAEDKVFICSWRGGWNLSSCTQISLNNLQGSEFLLQEFWNYEQAVKKIIKSYSSTHTPAVRQNLDLLSDYYGRFLNDVEWAEEKGDPARFERLFEMWAWVEKAREWNDVNREAFPDQDHYPLYLEYFHSGARIPNFQFVVRNEYSKAALNRMNKMNEKALKNTRCTCSCLSGACDDCRKKMNDHEPCHLKGNMIDEIHNEGLDSRTFEAVVCAPGQCPHSTPCSPPKREVSLMVAWRPDVRGVGLYATCSIPRHTVLCEYVGEVITERKANGQPHSYQYTIPRSGLVIEAMHKGNESRFVNHSCDPNLALLVLHEGSVDTVPRLFFVSRKDIPQGDELNIDYHPSYTFQKNKEPPPKSSGCACRAKTCRTFV